MTASLNIAALAARTGVAAETLRKWEERYAVLQPERTAGGQRRYSELDVRRVEWLKARLAEGYRIGEAASLLTPTPSAARTPRELRDALYEAAVATDADAIDALLDQTLTLYPLQRAVEDVLVPLLHRIGEGWSTGELSVAQEHLVSAAVRARLDRMLVDAGGNVRGVAVLACAPGERHELGLLMLATMLRADGWQVAYLGADTPFRDAMETALRLQAHALVVSVTMDERVTRLRRELERIGSDGLRVLVGGAAASRTLARAVGATFLEPDLARATATLRTFGS